MESLSFGFVLGLLGLMFGSFAAASVWRIRARQLRDDKKAGETVDDEEYTRLSQLATETVSSDRSRCLRCGHPLAWYDLLPLVSWLSLAGRCRYCKAPIGKFELISEQGVGIVFMVSYFFWPEPLGSPLGAFVFGLWLFAVVLLAILFSYDLKWYLLPDRVVFPLMGIGGATSILRLADATDISAAALSILGAVVVLSGLYYILWLVSKGEWIGFGDVKLGLALALLISDWKLAIIALFGANVIGTLLVLPGMLTGKIGRKTHISFGPLLIAGAVLAVLFGSYIVAWYQTVVF